MRREDEGMRRGVRRRVMLILREYSAECCGKYTAHISKHVEFVLL
jgi:hypothetical protein